MLTCVKQCIENKQFVVMVQTCTKLCRIIDTVWTTIHDTHYALCVWNWYCYSVIAITHVLSTSQRL